MLSINRKISELLKSQGLSQKDLATKIGKPANTINNWLNPDMERSIPSEVIIPICDFLGVDCQYLLSDSPSNVSRIDNNDTEWLTLIHKLPPEKQYELKGYVKRMIEESSVAADEPLKKTGTDKPGK